MTRRPRARSPSRRPKPAAGLIVAPTAPLQLVINEAGACYESDTYALVLASPCVADVTVSVWPASPFLSADPPSVTFTPAT